MDYNVDYKPPERISEELKRKIRFLVNWHSGGESWYGVTEEIIIRFYPTLSREEKLVCKELLECARDRSSRYCARHDLEDRLIRQCIFENKSQMRNTILILCSKRIVNWMTWLSPKPKNQQVFCLNGCEIYGINPESLYDIAMRAYMEVLEVNSEKDKASGTDIDCSFPLEYSKFLIWPKLPREFLPTLN